MVRQYFAICHVPSAVQAGYIRKQQPTPYFGDDLRATPFPQDGISLKRRANRLAGILAIMTLGCAQCSPTVPDAGAASPEPAAPLSPLQKRYGSNTTCTRGVGCLV